MVPAGPVPTAVPDPDADATPWADRRHGGRLLARAGVRIDIRAAESGPDVAIALLDVCPGGAKVAVRGAVRRGDRLLVSLGPPDGSWGYRGRGIVRWYVPGAEGTGLVGVQLRRPLSAQAAADLSE